MGPREGQEDAEDKVFVAKRNEDRENFCGICCSQVQESEAEENSEQSPSHRAEREIMWVFVTGNRSHGEKMAQAREKVVQIKYDADSRMQEFPYVSKQDCLQ
jgi:hypothetical protein